MDKILLQFETALTPAQLEFNVAINNKPVNYTLEQQQLCINTDVLFGVNNLTITASVPPGEKIVLTDFQLNGVSSRQTLYLAYEETPQGNKCNTWLTDQHPTLIIPFGNPISWWLSECGKKIPNTLYGTNIYDLYNIYYPTSVDIGSDLPQLMQDYMKYDFSIHVVDKTKSALHNKQVPWISIDLDYNEPALFAELGANISLLEANYYKPKQNQYNQKETANKMWHVAMAIHDHTVNELPKEHFPEFYKLIDTIKSKGVEILHAFVGTVHPNSYVAPHADDFYKHTNGYANTDGPSQFFIPIGWKKGNYFKFSGVGFIPFEQGAYIVNNSDFMHGSVNTSDSVRFTIGIYCNFTEENIQTLKST